MYEPDDIIIETNLKGVEAEWRIIRPESKITGFPRQYYAERLSDGFKRCVSEDMIRKKT